MFEEFFKQYESEEHEVFVLIDDRISTPTKVADNIYRIGFRTLAAQFCDSGEVVLEKMWLEFPLAEEDCNDDAVCQRFKAEQICHLKIRKLKQEFEIFDSTPAWCISQVLNENEECPVLSNLLEEYRKDVVIEDEMLGDLELDKEEEEFTSELIWCDDTVSFALLVNALDTESWAQAISAAKSMVSECKSWDKKMRKYAASVGLQEANYYLEDVFHHVYGDEYDENGNHVTGAKPKRLTERQFAAALEFHYLEVDAQGEFYASFRSRQYLGRATICVVGNVYTGIESSQIE